MPPVRMRGDGRKAKNPKQTIARLLSYLGAYKKTLIVVVICIVLNAIAQATSSASLGLLVDNYILPMLGQTNPDFGPLVGFLLMLAGIYLVGIISAFLYNFLMVRVGREPRRTSGTRCSPICRPFPFATLTPIPPAT